MVDVKVVELKVGDIYIIGDDYFKIVQGGAECEGGDVLLDNKTVSVQVIYEEVSEAHDSGCKVYEVSESFVGVWR